MTMDAEFLKLSFREDYNELNNIIHKWDLIPGAPIEEYDFLTNRILSNLYKGADFEKLCRVIDSELVVTYGFYPDEVDAIEKATEVKDSSNSKR